MLEKDLLEGINIAFAKCETQIIRGINIVSELYDYERDHATRLKTFG